MDESNDRAALAKGVRAQKILEADEYVEAWDTYRQNILAAFEKAKSDDVDTIMQLKRLLTSASASREHLRTLMVNGQVAAKTLELVPQRPLLKRLLG